MTSMVFKVAILEDEELIREGIKLKYPFDENEFEVVVEHDDGHHLLSLLRDAESAPLHVVLVDIMMPKMGGLEFIEEARMIRSDLKFVIISGYDDFDYAKKGIQLGVSDYILKPVDQEELKKTMDKLKRQLQQKAEAEKLLIHEELSLWFSQKEIRPLSKKAEQWLKKEWTSDLQLYIILFGNVSNVLEEEAIYKSGSLDFPIFHLGQHNLWIHFDRSVNYADHLFQQHSHKTITVAHFDGISDYLSVPFYVNRGINSIQNILTLGERKYVKESLDKEENSQNWNKIDDKYLLLLSELKQETSQENACNRFKKILKQDIPQIIKEQAFYRIAHDFFHIDISSEWIQSFNDPNDFYQECVHLIDRQSGNDQPATGREVLQKVLQDIKHEYMKKLTLKTYAEKYHIHPNYLARIFKSECQVTFLEYLTNKRIEVAKEKLRYSNEKTYEIAAGVGFEDPRYFSQVFRKYTGLTPTEYQATC
jgi:two-component system, response regulator YesN